MFPNETAPSRPAAEARRQRRLRRARQVSAATAAAAVVGAFLVGTPSAQAATIAVTTTADGGAGSLRAAIDQANANPGADVIDLPPGTYTLTIAGANEDANATGDLDITSDTTIVGAGAGVTTIDADGIDRVLDVRAGTLTVQSVTITGGNSGAGTTTGGGIAQTAGNLSVFDSIITGNHAWSGAGIVSGTGTLDVRRSEITSNVAVSEPGNGSNGGGIAKFNQDGSLLVTDSLVADNQSVQGNNGGLYSSAQTNVLVNSTFTGNTQYSRTITFEKYGTQTPGTATLRFVTIAGNTATSAPAGIMANVVSPAVLTTTLEGTLLQGNLANGVAKECGVQQAGTITTAGSNLTDDTTCTGLTAGTDKTNDTGTSLGALSANGGPTRTRALLVGSSAIDAATCNASVTTDQRGSARPVSGCDVGAYEVSAAVPPTTQPPTTLPPTTLPPTTTTPPTTATPTTEAPTTAWYDPNAIDTVTGFTGTIYTYRAAVGGQTVVATGSLPVTGPADTLRYGLVAVALIAGGAAALLGSRRIAGRRLDEELHTFGSGSD